MKGITQKEFEKRIEERYSDEKFEIIEYTTSSKPCKIKCLSCGKILEYPQAKNFLAKNKIAGCSNCRGLRAKNARIASYYTPAGVKSAEEFLPMLLIALSIIIVDVRVLVIIILSKNSKRVYKRNMVMNIFYYLLLLGSIIKPYSNIFVASLGLQHRLIYYIITPAARNVAIKAVKA